MSRHTIALMLVLAQEMRITTKEISSTTREFVYLSFTPVLSIKSPFKVKAFDCRGRNRIGLNAVLKKDYFRENSMTLVSV